MTKAEDVTDTLRLALTASDCDEVQVRRRPNLPADNGSSYVSGELVEWLEDRKMSHVHCAPYHPRPQGKIERWHQTLKNRIPRENYYLPVISKPRSGPSSSTTITGAITRAWRT